jgi:ribosome-binding protein aMBF1 (putative translation factor)
MVECLLYTQNVGSSILSSRTNFMEEKILKDLKTLRDNLEQEAQEARKHGGTMAMKLGSRVQIIQNAINYIESYERTQKT